MDDTTGRVEQMYNAFPYPSPRGGKNLKELRGLLTIFAAENHYDFKGKRILDAGTGTGDRLIEAARGLPDTQFLAVDISATPLEIARRAAAAEGVTNVEFRQANLMDDSEPLGAFDVILCMGVLHHLSDPAAGLRNLSRNLAPGGLLFLYIYGAYGARERMRRKRIVSLLRDSDTDFEQGIRLVKALGFDSFDYGWNLDAEDETSRNTLIVDAYLHVNEKLFDTETIFALMRSSGLYGFAVYGITLAQRGCLFDTRYAPGRRAVIETTAAGQQLKTPELKEAYERLSLADRYRLFDLLFEPNGYTLIAFQESGLAHLASGGRVAANVLRIADL